MQISWRLKSFSQLTLDELYEAMMLRQQVFIVEQNCPYNDADGIDPECWHLLGYRPLDRQTTDTAIKLVAYTRLLPPGLKYSQPAIGRVVTCQSVRRLGAGRQLMTESINALQQLFDTSACRISAQVYLLNFYRSFGFSEIGEHYLEDGIPHVDMVRKHQMV